ncbi:MAG: electron transport complex subunit RsxA [bacterium]|jgi:electron transport complex protein RnfA|nr:electron transport complex subunit RsxA [bacterium]
MKEAILIFLSAIFINNFVLNRFLGLCPFLGVSQKLKTSTGMGVAVMFVMTLASIITWALERFILVPFEIQYLRTISFILVIASLVQFVEMVIQKTSPALYQALGIFLPLITTNCAVLGVALLNITAGYSFLLTVVHTLGASIGFILALLLMAGIREELQLGDPPACMEGAPLSFVVAGLMAIAFSGFAGMM